ncbi:hypothetical protein lerEdw1_020715 [Lerista edwardsae]|nr:hypothetical protein lerEdw1_020715 [Lerista edwardsae]
MTVLLYLLCMFWQAQNKVRISDSLSEGEQTAVASRQEVVKKGLAKLGISCNVNQIPNIAVLGSGGGLRAMIALYGTLAELKKYNLLDCSMYLAGVSGSTWCVSALYKTEDWSEKIELLEKQLCEDLVPNQWDLKTAKAAVMDAARDEHYSLTDFWSYFIVYKLLNQMDESKLPDHRGSCESGKNPYPLYAAVDKDTYENQNPGTWFEFTPHEAGVPGLGAYVDMKYFGSMFRKGQLKEKKKEKNILYLQGLWGSALGSEKEILNNVKGTVLPFKTSIGAPEDITFLDESKLTEQRGSSENGKNPYPIYAAVDYEKYSNHQPDRAIEIFLFSGSWYEFTPHEVGIAGLGASIDMKDFGSAFENGHLKHKEKEKVVCYLQGLWGSALGSLEEIQKSIHGSHEIRAMEVPSRSNPNVLLATDVGRPKDKRRRLENTLNNIFRDWAHYLWDTLKSLDHWTWGTTNNFVYNCSDVHSPELTTEPTVSLIDAGTAINTAYPLVLRPEREVKLILSFDFSSGDPFETIRKTAEYCKANPGLRFPEINENELQDNNSPLDCYIFRGEGAPTVMHFPLFNSVNCPGEIEEYHKEFSTFKMSYSVQDIEKLLTAATTNVKNVHQKILEEIKRIVDSPSSYV